MILSRSKNSKTKKKYPERAKDVLVTQAMLFEVRDDLKAEVRSQFHQVDARFSEMESRFDKIDSQIHQIKLLVEEQNARNRIVLDGLTSLFTRQDRLEREFCSKS